jgi:HSP20 family protein
MATQKSQQQQNGGNTPATAAPSPPARYGAGDWLPGVGWEPLRRMQQEFDRIFGQAFGGWPVPWSGAGRDRYWGLDVDENENEVVVRAEAPGFEPDDFDIQVRGDQLVLRAAHKAEAKEPERGYREWHRQELYRSVALPPGIDPENVQATYRNGVLMVTLRKTEASKGRRIPVQG